MRSRTSLVASVLSLVALAACGGPGEPLPAEASAPKGATAGSEAHEAARADLAASEKSRATAPAAPPERSAAPAIRPILYVIRSGDQPASHLFGTIHVAISAKRALGEEGLALVERSRVLVTELPTDIDHAALLTAMVLPEKESLRGHVGDKRFEALAARIREAPPGVVDRLAPWAAMLQAGAEDMKRVARARGGDPDAGMDTELQLLAKQSGVPNIGLERVEDQVDLFTSIEPDLLLRLIDEAATPEGQEMVARLYEAYIAGDVDEILAITEEESMKEEAPELHERLLAGRNRAWMPTLVSEIERGGAFIAVGAAHLLGEDGLVGLLSDAGFEVERAPSDAH